MLYTAEYFTDEGAVLTECGSNFTDLFRTVQSRVASVPCDYAHMVIYTEDRIVKYAAEWWRGRKTWSHIARLLGRKYRPLNL